MDTAGTRGQALQATFRDGLGTRRLRDGADGPLEVLTLQQHLTASPTFEFLLRERVSRLAQFRQPCFACVHDVERGGGDTPKLAIVSDYAGGVRLSRMLAIAEQNLLPLDVDSALCLIRKLVTAIALLHEAAPDACHGALAPERVVVTPDARLVVVEHVLGAALEELQYSRERYWIDLRMALLPAVVGAPAAARPVAGKPEDRFLIDEQPEERETRLTRRTDVVQIGAIALALLLGRPLGADEYPGGFGDLATGTFGLGGAFEPLPAWLKEWLFRALWFDPAHAFNSAIDARMALDSGLAGSGYHASQSSLESFLEQYRASADAPFIVTPARPTLARPKPVASPAPPVAAQAAPPIAPKQTPIAPAPIAIAPTAIRPAPTATPSAPTAFTIAPTPIAIAPTEMPIEQAPVAHVPTAFTIAPPEIPFATAFTIAPTPIAIAPAEMPIAATPVAIAPTEIPFAPTSFTSAPAPIKIAAAEMPIAPAPVAPTESPIAPTAFAIASTEMPIAPASVAIAPTKMPIAPAPVAIAPTEIPFAPIPTPIPIAPAPIAFPAPRFGHQSYEERDEEVDVRQTRDERQGNTGTLSNSKRSRLIAAAVVLVALTSGGAMAARRYLATPPPASATATGTLAVQTNPAGAAVVIDGVQRGITPLSVSVSAGPHTVELSADTAHRTIAVNVTANSELSQFIEMPKATAAVGQLEVRTDPSGAKISVDGQLRGMSPLTVTGLATGSHSVTLENELGSVHEDVTIAPGTTASLVVPLRGPAGAPVSGWMSIAAPAELQVFENQRLLGNSRTDRIMVTAGRHDVEFVNEALGYRSAQTIQVAPGQVAKVKPDWPQGTLAINASPWANVWLDGQELGETPVGNTQVPIGTHEVIFRHPQLGEQRFTTTVTASTPARLSVDMRKKP